VGFQLTSRERFVAKPQLTVTFHNCEAFDYYETDGADYRQVVKPVLGRDTSFGEVLDLSIYRIAHRDYPVSWINRHNNVKVTLPPESFRPNLPWRNDQDDYVVVSRDPQATSVHVTWMPTEDSNDATTRGELDVATGPVLDAGELFKTTFLDKQ
jgi:hypothetical protein